MKKRKLTSLLAYIFSISTLPVVAYSTSYENNVDQILDLNSVYDLPEHDISASDEKDTTEPVDIDIPEEERNKQTRRKYLGISLVYDYATFNYNLGAEASATFGTTIKTSDFFNQNNFGFNINFGTHINEYFAIEGFFQQTYANQKKFKITWDSPGYYFNLNHIDTKMKFNTLSVGIDVLGFLPITRSPLSLVGSFGVGWYDTRWKSITDTWSSNNIGYTSEHDLYHGSGKENYLGFRFGLGAQYNFSELWATRLMLRYTKLNSDKTEDLLDSFVDVSLGLQYRF